MRYLLAMFLTMACLSTSLSAQEVRMRDVFAQMPDTILPLLTKNNRLDCIDFIENGMQAKVRNRFDDYAELTHLTDSYLHLQLSEASEVEMKLLQTKKGENRIVLFRTYAAPARDTHVECYDAEWRLVNDVNLPCPGVEEFWEEAPDSLSQLARFAQLSQKDLRLVKVSPSPDSPSIVMTIAIDELAEDEGKAAELLVRPLRYDWDGEAFRRAVK